MRTRSRTYHMNKFTYDIHIYTYIYIYGMKTCIHNLYHITMSVYVYDVHSWSSAGEFPIPISLSALLPSQVGKEALPLAQEFMAEQGTLGSGQMDLMA